MRFKKQFSTSHKFKTSIKKETKTFHQTKEQNIKKINIKNYQNKKIKKNIKLNLNDIVKKLNVKKRRIYDITNVLEGKNNII